MLIACKPSVNTNETPPKMAFDIEGHRGCRGLLPENSIPAFRKALDLGVTTLEMDVVISQDSQVVVSHEAYLSHEICLTSEGKEIAEADELTHNLFQMPYAEIAKCDCGTKVHPRFPDQEKMAVNKPLLSEVLREMEAYAKEKGRPAPYYNIEIKSDSAGDGIFHPDPETFFTLVYQQLKAAGVLDRVILQSFDTRALEVAHRRSPEITLAYLVENEESAEANFAKLSFTPAIYSPYFGFVNDSLMALTASKNMRVIPWTVNEPKDIRDMLNLGVAGIISDYPDRVIEALGRNDSADLSFAKTNKNMFVHHVFFWMKPGVDSADFRKDLEALAEIASVKEGFFGVPVPSDRVVVDDSFHFSELLFFANKADHDAYQVDPQHDAFVAKWKDSWDRVLVYDFSPDGK